MKRNALVLAATLCSGPLVAQTPPAEHAHQDSVPLYQNILGKHSWPITTAVPIAQAYFDQGVRLMYGYATDEANRAFAEARRRDPSCAMCWWGEAWSMGPQFNGGMDPKLAGPAHAAAQRARELAARATPVERALIEALAARFAPVHPPSGRAALDSAYVTALAGVYARFPKHVEVATMYADALMLLEPRRGIWPMTKPSVPRIHKVLEGVLAQQITHPGACHYYIHATETTPRVTAAQRCADLLSAQIPGISHVNHMPSHTYNRVGRWGDATRANIEAWHSDQREPKGQGFAIYPTHNLHMLLFSASVDGQGAIAMQAAKDYNKLIPADGAGLSALVLTRFGRFDEVLELRTVPVHPVHQGFWNFARGLAHLRLSAADSAARYLAVTDSIARNTRETMTFRTHKPARIVGILSNILRGELLRSQGKTEDALAALKEAITLEAGLTYDEPEPLPFSARDFLGALLLESGRAAEAVTVYQAALKARPHNGWSLFGLEQSLRALGLKAEADAAKAAFRQAWKRSEVLLTFSRF